MEARDIIARIYNQWLIAKEQRAQKCQVAGMTEVAKRLYECDLFKGTESVAEVAGLFTTPQGVEFCLAANFPNLYTLRLFKPCRPERYGFYIDAGNITLKNPKTAVLIGKTTAIIECDTCQHHHIITMHGASATVLASGWAVVRTDSGLSTNIVRRATDHAIIL